MRRHQVRSLAPIFVLVLALASSWCFAVLPAATAGAAPSERLTLDSFNKLMKAEQALAGNHRDANLERAIAMHGDADTIRRWATQLDADKKVSSAIKSAGLTTEEYTRTLVAVLQAYGVSGLKKQNKAVPEKLMAQVSDENVAFVEKHASEIESWGRKNGRDVKPNTMEDLYVEQDTTAADAPKAAEAPAAPEAKPASAPAAAKKKDSKSAPQTKP